MENSIIAQNKFFTAVRVGKSITQISGLAGEKCYLVEGSERALLIDGLTGVGSLKAFVRELTDLPVIMAVTHGHMDHTGAAWEYDEIFIHPDDIPLMYSDMHSGKERRLDFAKIFTKFGVQLRTELTLSDVVTAHPIKTYPIYDGDVFDLGGTQMEVIHVPGHTYGSVMFLDREKRVVFGGDGLNANTLLNLPGSASVEEYHTSLLHLKQYQNEFDVFWNGHDPEAIPNSIVDDGILLCQKIFDRKDAAIFHNDVFGGPSYLAASTGADGKMTYGGLCNIQYKLENIKKHERSVITGRTYGG